MSRSRRHGWLFGVAVALAVAAVSGGCGPTNLEPGPLLLSARLQGGDYRLVPKASVETKALVRASVFEGYSPDRHFDFAEALKERPTRFVREDSHHHYVEYFGRFGRIQLHSAFDRESGIDHWFECFPTRLGVDEFFVPDVAIILDVTRPKYTVYIPNGREQSYMTVRVAERQVHKVSWVPWYSAAQD